MIECGLRGVIIDALEETLFAFRMNGREDKSEKESSYYEEVSKWG